MASIQKLERTKVVKDKDGRDKEVVVTRYRARYRDRGGKEHAKHFELKRDAKNWLDEVATSVKTGMYVDPKAGRVTVGEYVEEWLPRQVHRERTQETYGGILRLHVLPMLGGMRLEAVERKDIEKLVSRWSQGGAAASTIEGRFTILAILFRAAVKDRRIPVSPCEDIKRPELPPKSALVPVTTDVVQALTEAMTPHYRAFVTVAAGSGLRRSEVFGLTRDRVSEAFGTIRVDRQLGKGVRNEVNFAPVKTGASTRTVPVAPVVIEAIQRHEKDFWQHESGLIFTSGIGQPLRPSTFWKAWRAAAEKVGTEATPHDLRHYFASVQIRGGTSIKALQQMLGHKSAVETWDTYGHLMGDEDERSRDVMQAELGNPADSLRTGVAPKLHLRRSEA